VGGKVPASIAEFGRLVTDQSGSADRGSSRTTLVVAGSVQVPSASPSCGGPSRAEVKQKPRSGASHAGTLAGFLALVPRVPKRDLSFDIPEHLSQHRARTALITGAEIGKDLFE